MLLVVKSDLAWLAKHGIRNDNRTWSCRTTQKEIVFEKTSRSVEDPEVPGKFSIKTVTRFHCPACTPKLMPIPFGSPIAKSDLGVLGATV